VGAVSDLPGSLAARERSAAIEECLPFFFVGGAAMLVGVYLLLSDTNLFSNRLPFWALLVAVGWIALAGASVAMLIGEEDEGMINGSAARDGDLDLVPKHEPSELGQAATSEPPRASLTVPPHAARVAARPYLSQMAAPRPIWEEDWDVDSEGFRAAAAPPAPADLVLRQIEELEVSLRKTRTRPPSD